MATKHSTLRTPRSASDLSRSRVRMVVGLLAVAAVAAWAPAQTQPPSATDLLPDTVLATLTIHDGVRQVKAFRECRILERYLDSEAFEALRTQPDFLKAQGGLFLFAGSVGMEPWTMARQVLGRDLTIALLPSGIADKPHVIAVLRPDEQAAAERMLDALLGMTGAKLNGQPVEGRSKVVDGVRGYELNPEAYVASFDGVVVFSNHAETLRKLVEQRGERGGKLAASAEYRAGREAVPKGVVASAHVNLRAIKAAAGEKFNRKFDNFVGAMLAGGWVDRVRNGDAAVLWLEADADQVRVGGRVVGGSPADSKVLPHFTVVGNETRDWSQFRIPGMALHVEITRAWSGFWEAREQMLDADGLRGAAEFAGALTTFMGGLDFSSELLPELRPTLRFLAARQNFDGPAPTPELPAFALLVHLKDAARLGARLENAAMMTFSLFNFDMGQKGMAQYQMSIENHAGTRMLIAKFPESTDPGPRGVRYNFEPAVAVVGDRFVIATSRHMLEDIIDAVAKLPAAAEAAGQAAEKALGAAVDGLYVNLQEAYRILAANREAFVTNQMLEQDIERERAERDVQLFLDAARLLSDLSLKLQTGQDGLVLSARLGLAN